MKIYEKMILISIICTIDQVALEIIKKKEEDTLAPDYICVIK